MSHDIVLFLGAGFSKSAGLPIMNEFGEESNKELQRERDGLKQQSKGKEKFEFFIKKGEIFKNFQKHCKNSKRFVNFNKNNLEDIFCIAEIYKNYGDNKIRLNSHDEKIEDIFRNIQIWLWKIYHQLPTLTSRGSTDGITPEPYIELMRIIKELGVEKRLYIITTNYDIVFEYYAFKGGLKCCYPIDYHSLNNVYTKKYISEYNEENNNRYPILCKLHGSINYFNNSERKLLISDNIIQFRGEDRPEILDMLKAELIVQRLGLVPLIIPPTFSKLEINEWQKKTWNTALKALREAKKIIFIGYSMPSSDGFMKAFIQASMVYRNKNLPLEISIIDPSIETHERFEKIFSPLVESTCKSNLNHILKCFSEECLKDVSKLL